MNIVLVTDLTGIWFKRNRKYEKFVQSFLERHGAKSIGDWSKYSKLARVGKLEYEEALRLWLKDCGIEDENAVKEFIEEENKILKNSLKFMGKRVLKKLSKIVKIVGVTDSPFTKEKVMKFLEIGRIDKYFYDIITSYDIKMEKPESFKYVLEKFGNFIFLGHDDDEIIGAKIFGIRTIGLKNNNAEITIENLNELVGIFENLIKFGRISNK